MQSPTCSATSRTYEIPLPCLVLSCCTWYARANRHREQRAETDFFTGEPLKALSTLVYSQNIDLQRSASLTFAEITERGMSQWREGGRTEEKRIMR